MTNVGKTTVPNGGIVSSLEIRTGSKITLRAPNSWGYKTTAGEWLIVRQRPGPCVGHNNLHFEMTTFLSLRFFSKAMVPPE